jgi:hypothetical protein
MVDEFLVTAGDLSEFRRQGEGDQKVRHRQEQILLLLQPLLASRVLAFGTVAVLAGVIAVLSLIAMVTVVKVIPQGFGAAVFDVSHSLPVAG